MEPHDLMMDRSDVNETQQFLVRLLRVILFKSKFTYQDIIDKHSDFYNRHNLNISLRKSDRGNMKKNLMNSYGITIKFFEFMLENILRFKIIRISVTIEDTATGEIKLFHSDDALE